MVYVRDFPWIFSKNVSEEMVKAGCKPHLASDHPPPRADLLQLRQSTPRKARSTTVSCLVSRILRR